VCARDPDRSGEPDFGLRIGIRDVSPPTQVVGDGQRGLGIQLAAPGSICISDRVYDDLRNHPEFEPRLLGERELKNVNRRITVYVLAAPGQRAAAEPAARRSRRWRVWAGAAAAGVVALAALLWITGPASASSSRR
jgi:hypothetical protein